MLTWIYFGNTLQAWLTAMAITVTTYLILWVIHRIALVRLQALAQRTATQIDNAIADVLSKTGFWFTSYLSLYAGSRFLTLPEQTNTLLRGIAMGVLLIQIAIWANRLVTYWVVQGLRRRHAGDASMQTMASALGFISRILIVSALLLTGMQNLGIEIDTLLAGLGIGGIAVALALQSVLGDLFASLSIVFDKPFLIGDFIILDNGMMGTVENVGLKTTRIRAMTGEELVIANNDLLRTRIRNYRKMQNRMVSFTLNVTYQTSHAKLRQIPGIIRTVVDDHPQTTFEWANFVGFGAYSLDFDVAYYVKDYEWYRYLAVREEIYLEIFRRFTEEEIEFAYPTQTLLMGKSEGA